MESKLHHNNKHARIDLVKLYLSTTKTTIIIKTTTTILVIMIVILIIIIISSLGLIGKLFQNVLYYG